MNALNTLKSKEQNHEAGLSDVDILLGATREIEHRMQGPQRAFMLWRQELWQGFYLLSRYRVEFLNAFVSYIYQARWQSLVFRR